ncbi:hypothetical protein WICPIJ_008921 [Wickerhamomyces pijperi]|uniref:Essential protein Yae1 N-terminal domain-containing protein n=1 Tax=Wickerhamomyces pijperi TaxID=599730 RepID=A0A9P8PTK3_WICPI|nr:hypothetical protein WICPIJ_008921 [Wickerhamomyces pijperi]
MDFDDVLNLEEQFYQDGFAYGQAQSALTSFKEGKEYGLQTAFQKYLLVGQIQGLFDILELTHIELSTQAANNIKQIKEFLTQITYDNDYGNVINTEKIITKIRNKMRVLVNLIPELDKKSCNLSNMDELSRFIGGLEGENGNGNGKNSGTTGTGIGALTDDGMW